MMRLPALLATLNGEKGMLSEGGIRVPWLASWKGTIPGGQVYPHPVISLDIAATAVAAAGLANEPSLDGVNLVPFFTGASTGMPHEVLFWRWSAQSAIREGRWKLLIGGSRSYLFDLEADPGERRNLVEEQPAVARRLRARLDAWAADLQPPGVGIRPMAKTWEDYFDHYLDGKPAKRSRQNAQPGGPRGGALRQWGHDTEYPSVTPCVRSTGMKAANKTGTANETN